MFLLRATEEQAASLLYLAGYLAGAGLQEEANDLKAVISTAIAIEEFEPYALTGGEYTEDGGADEVPDPYEPADVAVTPEQQALNDLFAGEIPGGEVPHIDPSHDPTAPENLGIALEQVVEAPPPAPPNTRPDDFGAGPPPRGA